MEELKEIKEKYGKQIDYFTDNKLGIIVANSFDNNKKNIAGLEEKLNDIHLVLDCHIDLIKLFNTDNNLKLNIDGDKVIGALDNTITNAILLNILKQKDLADDTLILFSIGEEHYCKGKKRNCDINEDAYCNDVDDDCRGFKEKNGARKLAKIIKQKKLQKKIKVINLDVTGKAYHGLHNKDNKFDNCSYAAFIEYDPIPNGEEETAKEYEELYTKTEDERYGTLNKFQNFPKEFLKHVTFCDYNDEGTGDNLEKYQKRGIFGITFGLSTSNKIHSKNNYTTKSKIENYTELLKNLIEEIKKVVI
ncbi:M28 family peptidase [Aliarcobacter butzleri]|uniref:M28 family peptidase n=1 Tax=Aliarcobacter butzleri TaxID=28197 RepID=UPI0021B30D40|nr:M28 family peptidase [Aliarcobacter butzleri]MCT7633001.1 M28 family peptidase [Aliarcobacter butzleri]